MTGVEAKGRAPGAEVDGVMDVAKNASVVSSTPHQGCSFGNEIGNPATHPQFTD